MKGNGGNSQAAEMLRLGYRDKVSLGVTPGPETENLTPSRRCYQVIAHE